MSLSSREQLVAFIALIASILILGLAPVVMAGIMGKVLPDSLIAVSDKTVTGLVGVLGTICAMIFRTTRVDDVRAENSGKAFDAITATANAGTGTGDSAAPQKVEVVNKPSKPVPVDPKTKGAAKP